MMIISPDGELPVPPQAEPKVINPHWYSDKPTVQKKAILITA
jgi:hypothetical protein